MASKAEESLGVYFRKLYNSDDMGERDFTFLSNENTKFPVHSFMFKQRSEFLTNLLLNTNFKEGTEKVAKLDLSHKASEKFVKFLYGFSLSWDKSKHFEILKELIFYAGMCGLGCLQKAATSVFEENLDKTNVLTIFEILKKNEVDSAEVVNFVVENFTRSELLQKKIFEKFPEVAVSIVKKEANMIDFRKILALDTTSNIQGPNTGPIVKICQNTTIDEHVEFYFEKSTFSRTGMIQTELELIIHGIGLTLLPGSNVNVEVEVMTVKNCNANVIYKEDIEVSVPVSSIPKVFAVKFLEPLRLKSSGNRRHKMKVSVEGSGFARIFPKTTRGKYSSNVFGNIVSGENIVMDFYSAAEQKPPIIIAEIYCSFPQNCPIPQLHDFS